MIDADRKTTGKNGGWPAGHPRHELLTRRDYRGAKPLADGRRKRRTGKRLVKPAIFPPCQQTILSAGTPHDHETRAQQNQDQGAGSDQAEGGHRRKLTRPRAVITGNGAQ